MLRKLMAVALLVSATLFVEHRIDWIESKAIELALGAYKKYIASPEQGPLARTLLRLMSDADRWRLHDDVSISADSGVRVDQGGDVWLAPGSDDSDKFTDAEKAKLRRAYCDLRSCLVERRNIALAASLDAKFARAQIADARGQRRASRGSD
jgi:hypothetical protein